MDESVDGAGGFVKDQRAAILLGKALFWDQQAGSEDMACATCHYHAGADNRSRNQLSPGIKGGNAVFDPTGSGGQGINHTLTVDDFPFHKLADPNDRDSVVFFDTDDVVSSAGTFAADFNDIVPGDTIDDCTSVSPDPFGFIIQSVGGPLNTRRVEPRNAPTVINAVFNFRNFWDGRANNVFNGVDSSGFRNKNAQVLKVQGANVVQTQVAFENSSLASQAVGPPLSDFEMSCTGRIFPKLGKKLLSLDVLGRQRVHPSDSVLVDNVLDVFSQSPAAGLQYRNGNPVEYADLIQLAFADRLWNSNRVFDADGNEIVLGSLGPTDEYNMMEANFALFWGLAIQLYESTLVSDDTPFDQSREGVHTLTDSELAGQELFFTNTVGERGNCSTCHQGPTFTTAAFPFREPESGEFPEVEQLVERMRMGNGVNIAENLFRYFITGEGTIGGMHIEGTAGSWQLPSLYPGAVGGAFLVDNCVYQVDSFLLNVDTTVDPDPNDPPPSPGPPQNPDTTTKDAVFTLSGDCDPLQVTIIDGGPGNDLASIAPILEPMIKEPLLPPIPAVIGPPLAEGQINGDFVLGGPTLYDTGFYNIGVRPTAEDPGIGAEDDFGVPLSFTGQWINSLLGVAPPDELLNVNLARVVEPFSWFGDAVFFPGGFAGPGWITHKKVPNPAQPFCVEPGLPPPGTPRPEFDSQADCEAAMEDPPLVWNIPPEFILEPVLDPSPGRGNEAVPAYDPNPGPYFNIANEQAIRDMPTAVDGSFKTSGLRNVELTGPYFHNGGHLTLEQVVDFYSRGGDFAIENLGPLSPNIHPLGLDETEKADLVAFLKTLTDERVRCELAPFDHPEIKLPEGTTGSSAAEKSTQAADLITDIPAVGAGGRPAAGLVCLQGFLE